METDPAWRKARPLVAGCLDYFPDALLEVAHCSFVGNEQHNPGEPLHWAKEKSKDEADACVRHLLERGTIDTDGVRHSAKAAWRALANLQRELEAAAQETTVPVKVPAPEAKLPLDYVELYADCLVKHKRSTDCFAPDSITMEQRENICAGCCKKRWGLLHDGA